MRFLSVVGARPQFIKAGPLSAVLRTHHDEVLVHTGQHYDAGMSDVFFEELGIPAPEYHLGIGGGSHGKQTGAMIAALEEVICKETPDVVLVYGDTNSTLAAAVAASKLRVKIAHVEAGLRSFNRAMPEEINRVMADHVSHFLFAPSEAARAQLEREGITSGVHVVGDIMLDAVQLHRPRAAARSQYPAQAGVAPRSYYAATIHRAENTDDRDRLAGLLSELARLDLPVLLPLHPRTRRQVSAFGIEIGENIRVLEPLGYLDMLQVVACSACVLTDSGGLQKEAYYLEKPCVTLRTETEWTETVDAGWNVVVGHDTARIAESVRQVTERRLPHPDLYGSGDSAQRIVAAFDS